MSHNDSSNYLNHRRLLYESRDAVENWIEWKVVRYIPVSYSCYVARNSQWCKERLACDSLRYKIITPLLPTDTHANSYNITQTRQSIQTDNTNRYRDLISYPHIGASTNIPKDISMCGITATRRHISYYTITTQDFTQVIMH